MPPVPTRSRGRWSDPSGIVTANVVPVPTSLSAVIDPPCSLTSSCTSARPMPLPSCVRPRAFSTRWNRSNSLGISAAGMPVPVSRTRSSTAPPARRRATAIPPSRVNLKALDSRLRTTFSHIGRSTNTGSPTRRAVHRQGQPGLLAGRPEVAGEVGGEGGEVGRLVGRPHPPGLDPGEVEQGVDEPLEPQPVAVDDLQQPAGRRAAPARRAWRACPRPGRA